MPHKGGGTMDEMMKGITDGLKGLNEEAANAYLKSVTAKIMAATEASVDENPAAPDSVVMRAAQGSPESMRKLIAERGVDPSLADDSGLTPLMYASEHANVGMMRLLIDSLFDRLKPVDSQRPGSGMNALHCACFGLSTVSAEHVRTQPPDHAAKVADAAGLLVRHGGFALLQQVDAAGRTPFQLAMERWEAAGAALELGFSPQSPLCKVLLGLMMDPLAGCTAKIHGLVGAAEHNGQRVAIIQPIAGAGRYVVELLASGRSLRVRPANLMLMSAARFEEERGGVGVEHAGQPGVLFEPLNDRGLWSVQLDGGATVEAALAGVTLRCEGADKDLHPGAATMRSCWVSGRSKPRAAARSSSTAAADGTRAASAAESPAQAEVERLMGMQHSPASAVDAAASLASMLAEGKQEVIDASEGPEETQEQECKHQAADRCTHIGVRMVDVKYKGVRRGQVSMCAACAQDHALNGEQPDDYDSIDEDY